MVFQTLIKISAIPLAAFFVLAYFPGFLDISPVHYKYPAPRNFSGTLEPNHKLSKAEKLLNNNIHGAESLTFYRGAMYTGLQNGWIVRITEDHLMEPIATIGDPHCKHGDIEACGRPAGIRINRNGSLVVADAIHGLYDVNIKTGISKPIFRTQEVDGKRPMMINDFDMLYRAGEYYISESTHKFPMKEMLYEFLESGPNGRILQHSMSTNTTKVLVDGLAFPNGVELSPKRDFLLISETLRKRIMKYHLRGDKEGKLEVFIDNLPGYPDNIRSNGEGGYFVPLVTAHAPNKPDPLQRFGPTIRKVAARVISLIQSVLKCFSCCCPSTFTKTLLAMITDPRYYMPEGDNYGLILELNKNGDIIRSLHSPDGSISGISEVGIYGDALYLASPSNRYIGKLTNVIKTL